MNPLDVAHTYFTAWNRRDPAAIVATFAEDGTYSDPTVPPLTGGALTAYTSGLFAAFPDLSFEIVSAAQTGDHTIAAQWMMRGTHTGPLAGNPPTGKTVALPGADFITVEGDKIRSVQVYFDQKTLMEQLGLQVIVQPYALGPISFGTSSLQAGKSTRPGAFGLTAIQVRSDEERQQLRVYGGRVEAEVAHLPGFISLTTLGVGHRVYTISAWEDAEHPRQLLRSKAHRQAMNMFFTTDFSLGAMTSVWIPHYMNMWVRCLACGSIADYEQLEGKCQCGQLLPQLPYW